MFKSFSPPDTQMQPTDLAACDEPTTETAPEQIEAPRIKAPLPPQFGVHCCYPLGEPRTLGFRYCTAPVAQRSAPYCLEHMRLCHMGRDIAA
jgi:hypothetical protein